jgi:hypothetical protein
MSNYNLRNNPSPVPTNFDEFLDRLTLLENKVDQLSAENIVLKKQVKDLNDYADESDDMMYELEKKINQIDQYIRRENIIITGLPDNIDGDHIEQKVIEMLNKIDVKVETDDIVACHRLQKTSKEKKSKLPAKTIVRFGNRKNTIKCLKNKKQLGTVYEDLGYQNNIFINENLCPAHQTIFDRCGKLKYEKKIARYWSFNGVVNIKLTENRLERPRKILTMDDLYEVVKEQERSFVNDIDDWW